jgi:hypothetical protein
MDDLARLAARVVSPAGQRKGRTVVRFDRADLSRLDALRASLSRLPSALGARPSRAALVRVLVDWGLDRVEALASGATLPPSTGAP